MYNRFRVHFFLSSALSLKVILCKNVCFISFVSEIKFLKIKNQKVFLFFKQENIKMNNKNAIFILYGKRNAVDNKQKLQEKKKKEKTR